MGDGEDRVKGLVKWMCLTIEHALIIAGDNDEESRDRIGDQVIMDIFRRVRGNRQSITNDGDLKLMFEATIHWCSSKIGPTVENHE